MKIINKKSKVFALLSTSLLLMACQNSDQPSTEAQSETDQVQIVDQEKQSDQSETTDDSQKPSEAETEKTPDQSSGEESETETAKDEKSAEDIKIEDFYGSYEGELEISPIGISFAGGEEIHHFLEAELNANQLNFRSLLYPTDPSFATVSSGSIILNEDGSVTYQLTEGSEEVTANKVSDDTPVGQQSDFHPDLYQADKKVAQKPGTDVLVPVIDFKEAAVVSSAEDAQSYLEDSAALNGVDLGTLTLESQSDFGSIPLYQFASDNGESYVVSAQGNICLYNNGYMGLDWTLAR